MKVAFILPSLLNRGPIVFTRYLVNALIEFGVDVSVFYIKPLKELDFNCECQKLNLFSTNQLHDFDIVHTTMLRPDFFGFLHQKTLRNKWVVSMHNEISADLRFLYPKHKANCIEFFWRLALKNAKNIITSSQAQLQYYKCYIEGERNYGVIGYGIEQREPGLLSIDEDSFFSALKEKYRIIGSCGLLIPRKGFDQLVDFLLENKDFAVILIGSGECENELREQAKILGVEERFFILGFKNNHIDYYPYFDIYALTSHSEGFGLAMIEAMSLGLPIVCSDLEIYNEYFDSEQVGLFTPGDKKEFSWILNDVWARKDMYAKKSKDLFIRKFSSKIMAKKHIEYYENILK